MTQRPRSTRESNRQTIRLDGGYDGLPDYMIGGLNRDTFVLHKPYDGSNETETIFGFDPQEDKVVISDHW